MKPTDRHPTMIDIGDVYRKHADEMRREEIGGMRIVALVVIAAPLGLVAIVWGVFKLFQWVNN